MSRFSRQLRAIVLALLGLSLPLPGSLMAGPIIVSINDVPNAPPVIQVQDAPNGYEVYTGELVADPTIEDGALILLFGVDNAAGPNPLADWGGRFVDSRPWQLLPPLIYDGINYRQLFTAVDIVWVEHNFYVPEDSPNYGDLIVGFNSAFPGVWYRTPGTPSPPFSPDAALGPVTDRWVTVYANETLVIRYKPHTYVAKGYVPFKGSLEIVAGPPTPTPELPDNPNAFAREYEGEGIASHLGKLQVSMALTIYPDQASAYTDPRGFAGVAVPYVGNAVLTTTNHDRITCHVTGIEGLTVSPWWLEGELQVTEGTGRFEGASGYMTFTGLEDENITVDFEGTISAVGKNK